MPVSAAQLRHAGIAPATFYYAARIVDGDAEMPTHPDKDLTIAINYLKEKFMPKGKKALPPATQAGPEFVKATPPALAAREADMNLVIEQQAENAQALAEQLGYDGSLTVGALEDEIRFYQRRSVEACLELGKRLLLLKELTPHGDFLDRIEMLGISHTMAKRFMASTVKFSNGASTHLLKAAGTQTKLLELLVLDDGEIEALESGESARGLTLDEVETMTVSELRAALREAKETSAAKDRLLTERTRKLDELTVKKTRVKTEAPDDVLAGLRHELAGFVTSAEHELAGKVLPAMRAIIDHHAIHGGESTDFLEGAMRQVERMATTVRLECGLGEL